MKMLAFLWRLETVLSFLVTLTSTLCDVLFLVGTDGLMCQGGIHRVQCSFLL